eukprot:216856-Chlamydomonas_euryale.AAC.3
MRPFTGGMFAAQRSIGCASKREADSPGHLHGVVLVAQLHGLVVVASGAHSGDNAGGTAADIGDSDMGKRKLVTLAGGCTN